MNHSLRNLGCCSAILLFAAAASAHGGQYRGPGDVVPPNPGGGGGQRPPPAGPGQPGGPNGPGPVTPRPGVAGGNTPGPGVGSGGGAAGGTRTGGRGISIGDDLTKWQFWWEFNKDPYISLKESIHASVTSTGSDVFYMGGSRRRLGRDTMKPTEADVVHRVLPALKRAIDSTDQRDIVSSCMVALAKIGLDHPDFRLLEVMRDRLPSRDQEIRETAALAMGISQLEGALEYLPDLARDTAAGQRLVDRPAVDARTRAFACYGLGLLGHASNNAEFKRRCYAPLREIVEQTLEHGIIDRNVPVAAINGIRLIRPTEAALRDECIDTLWRYYRKAAGPGEQIVQAHVPPAVAQLLGRGGDSTGEYKAAFAAALGGAQRSREIQQSAALALGILCQPAEDNPGDARFSHSLRDTFANAKDQQTRNFALIGLGQIGGDANRNALLTIFAKGNKALVKPWAAIALGVLAHGTASDGRATTSGQVEIELRRALASVKNGQTLSAIAVALGLCRSQEAAPLLRALLDANRQRDELAGYLCIGLALVGHDRSRETIREIVDDSVRRPDLLKQAAIALGKLGDKSVTNSLQQMLMEDTNRNVAKLSAIASALGFIGDKRTIDPLIKMLHDESITELSRAFAAVALGGVADKEPLPWNSKISVDLNYRAAVETLTNQLNGVLDIL